MEKLTCRKCNEDKPLKEFYYERNRKQYSKSCKKCNGKQCGEYQRKSGYRNTLNYVFYQRAYNIKRDKAFKGIVIMDNLKEHLENLWLTQNQKCYYTGIEMNINGYKKNPLAMTVDRIIPSKGYIDGNIALCCNMVNKMKQDLSLDELVNWCKLISTGIKSLQSCNV